MTKQTTSHKPAHQQGSNWQNALQDYKNHMASNKQQQTNKAKHDSGKAPHKSTSKPGQESRSGNKQQSGKPAVHQKHKTPHNALQSASGKTAKKQEQERVRPHNLSLSQWKNLKRMRRVTALWPALFNHDNPKPLKVGVLDDLKQDITARGLNVGTGALRAAIASYTRRIMYKKAIVAGGARYDMNGQPCGEVTPEQQREAADELSKSKSERSDAGAERIKQNAYARRADNMITKTGSPC